MGNEILVCEIEKCLNEKIKNKVEIVVKKSVGSTNDEVKRQAEKNEGYIIVSCSQTQGKGRLGRSFFSPDNTGLYMSILLKPQFKPEQALGITTAAAVAVCRALEKFGVNPSIKWVNDIFVDGKKVCGILTESAVNIENRKLSYAVLGIGLNIYNPENDFPDEIKNIAGAIFSKGTENLRNRLCGEIINEFFYLYDGIGMGRHTDEYIRRNFVIGKNVLVLLQGEAKKATVTGITNSCELEVTYESGEKVVLSSGEISLKL